MGTAKFMVKWKDHSNTLSSVCKILLDDNFLLDCTLAAEGQCLKAHRLILSACSPYFQLLFKQHNEKHPIVFFNDAKFVELKALIDFVYQGEAHIPEDRLGAFFQLARSFQIKGLNDVENISTFLLSSQTSSNNSIGASSDLISECSTTHSPGSHSTYLEKDLRNEQETVNNHSKNSCESASANQRPFSVDVCTTLVKVNTTIPVKECHDSHREQINSPSISQQHSHLVEELPNHAEQIIKCEPDESEDKPNLQLIDVEVNYRTTEDKVANGMNKKILSGCQEENTNSLFQGTSSLENETVSSENSFILPTVSCSPGYHPVEEADSMNGLQNQNQLLSSPMDIGLLKIQSEDASPESAVVILDRREARLRSKKARHFKCDICLAGFTQKAHLLNHMYSHTGERPFKCNICLSSFSRGSNLKRHMILHTGEKPYKCDLCLAAFADPSALRNHWLRHRSKRLYKCKLCNATFYFPSELRCHVRSHSNEKSYVCGECGFRFKHSQSRLRHQRMYHPFSSSLNSQPQPKP